MIRFKPVFCGRFKTSRRTTTTLTTLMKMMTTSTTLTSMTMRSRLVWPTRRLGRSSSARSRRKHFDGSSCSGASCSRFQGSGRGPGRLPSRCSLVRSLPRARAHPRPQGQGRTGSLKSGGRGGKQWERVSLCWCLEAETKECISMNASVIHAFIFIHFFCTSLPLTSSWWFDQYFQAFPRSKECC